MITKTLLASVAIMLIATVNAEYDVAKYCQLVKTGTKMPSMESCQDYYICGLNNQPIPGKCDANTVFDKDTQGCVPEAQGNCFLSLDNPCENKDDTFAPSTKACNEWHYCLNGKIAANGTCQLGQIFYASNSTCINGDCPDGNSNSGFTPVLNLCDIMQNDQFFGDFENCNAWHRCNNGKPQNGKCLDNLVYDTKKGMCLKNDGTMCDRTGGISAVSGAPNPSLCTQSNVDNQVGDQLKCSVYYVCTKDTTSSDSPISPTYNWKEDNCGYGEYFDVLSKECLSRSKAHAYPGCNRCEFTTGSTTYWVNADSSDCSKFSTCRNGQKLSNGDGNCSNGYYFDEAVQYCIQGNEKNGACANYKCDENRVCTLQAPA